MDEAAVRGPRIRVLIVAGNDLFRSGLAALLAKEPDIEVVAEAPSGRSGVQLASQLRPDVVLVSLRLSDLKGSEATRAILQRSPTTRVLAFIVPPNRDESSDRDEIERVIRAGASGFLAGDTPDWRDRDGCARRGCGLTSVSASNRRGGARSPASSGCLQAATPWGGPAISTRTRGIALDQSGAG